MITIPTYDYDQRHWRKICGPEELSKIGELTYRNTPDEIIPSTNDIPTVKIKSASIINKDDRADKVLGVLTGNI